MSTAYEELVALSDVVPDEWPSRGGPRAALVAGRQRTARAAARAHPGARTARRRGGHHPRSSASTTSIPLLFAHSNYKSYPEGFIAKGRWDLMNKWLDTLSSMRVDDVDVEGVNDQDDWVERLHTVGQKAYVTSGTTGKNSFLPQTPSDEDLLAEDADPVDPAPAALRRRAAPSDLHLRPEVRPPPGRAPLPHPRRDVRASRRQLLPHRGADAHRGDHAHGRPAQAHRRGHRDAERDRGVRA